MQEQSEKLRLSKAIETQRGMLSMALKALGDALRLQIIEVLLRNEAVNPNPLSFTDLKGKLEEDLGSIASNRFAYHLSVLQEAGFLQRTVALPGNPHYDQRVSMSGRSFYRTTTLAMLLLLPRPMS